MLNSKELVDILENTNIDDPFLITPLPDLDRLKNSGSASIDLRLGTWFVAPINARMSHLSLDEINSQQSKLTKTRYVPYGESYYLHPNSFVLGITLEWICMPREFAGYLIGRSSWGRRGLIIATATGIHPGFKGCLTLEMSNIGEIPIEIKPGMQICQLFVHRISSPKTEHLDASQFIGRRKPILGKISLDDDKLASLLARAYSEKLE